MLRVGHIIGSRLEPAFSGKLHRLELRNAVDELRLSADHLDRQELTATTRGGQDVAIALPRHERLFDGAVLLLDDNSAVVVRASIAHSAGPGVAYDTPGARRRRSRHSRQ